MKKGKNPEKYYGGEYSEVNEETKYVSPRRIGSTQAVSVRQVTSEKPKAKLSTEPKKREP